jgi:putative chitinase
MNDPIYDEMTQPRGAAYRSDQIVAWSHYRTPIDASEGRLAGNSRRWGDASPEVQSRVVDRLVAASREAGLDARETAYVLAIARVESGFNPDAAAGTTSASGLGQFIDRTGAAYGLGDGNRFDARAQAEALVAHYIDNRDLARSRGQGEAYIYKYHHDGPTRDYGGLGIAERQVMPYLDRYERFVEARLERDAGTRPVPPSPSARSFDQAMAMILPPQGGVRPHITGHYGEHRAGGAHGGTDFNYVGGQTGINLRHPTVHSPVSGRVSFSGGSFGTVKIVDADGNSHEFLHLHQRHVREGDTVAAGDPIGTMGGRGPNGPNQYAQHVHYQLRDAQGRLVSPERFWDEGRGPAAGTPRDTAPPTLRLDSRGDAVRGLQQALDQLGYRDDRGRPLQPDGVFGPRTEQAVRTFQRAHGLEPDGIVGRETRAAMERARAPAQGDAAARDDGRPGASPHTPLGTLLQAAGSRDPEALREAMAGLVASPAGEAFQQRAQAHAREACPQPAPQVDAARL